MRSSIPYARRWAVTAGLALSLLVGAALASCSGGDAPFFNDDAGAEGSVDGDGLSSEAGETDGAGGADASEDAPEDAPEDATVHDATSDASSDTGADGMLEDAAADAPFDALGDSSLDAEGDANDAALDAFPPFDGGDSGLDCGATGPDGEPTELGCTGLYSDWPTRTVSSDLLAFDPGIHLWSDGAEKSRWIRLPPGTQIDTTDMNEWVFPVGTRLWKEFRLNGLKVETRLLWKKSASQWVRTAYAWSQDQSTATELTTGALDVWGTGYEIPTQADCTECHQGHVDGVLGFEVIGLSTPQATGATMAYLQSHALVTQAPASPVVIPGNATEVAALGWLHANCGNACHSSSPHAEANFISLRMRLRTDQLTSVQATDTYTTAVNVSADFPPDAGFDRIKPHDPDHSCIPFRDGQRDGPGTYVPPPFRTNQMPPLATHKVDTVGLQIVVDWINSM